MFYLYGDLPKLNWFCPLEQAQHSNHMPLNCWVWLASDCLRVCAFYVVVDIVSFGCQGYFAVMEDEGKWIGDIFSLLLNLVSGCVESIK